MSIINMGFKNRISLNESEDIRFILLVSNSVNTHRYIHERHSYIIVTFPREMRVDSRPPI